MPVSPWKKHESPAGFSIDLPPGWSIQPDTAPLIVVANADSSQAAMIEHLPATISGTPSEILKNGRFSATVFFKGITPHIVTEGPPAASYVTNFQYTDGRPMRVRVRCKKTRRGLTVFAAVATQEAFPYVEEVLQRILNSYQRPGGEDFAIMADLTGTPIPAPPPSPPIATLSYIPFTDTVAGTFTVDVPKGWPIRGGLHHAGLGDRRLWTETHSPDGIIILQGDPNCPQCFCYYPMQVQNVMVPTPQGCAFLNISPSAKKLSNYYFKSIVPQRFGSVKFVGERERRDVAEQEIQIARAQGIPVAKSMHVSIYETRFEVNGRHGVCYASCWVDNSMSLGFMTVWQGSILVWVAPAALMPLAEQVTVRMRNSFRVTPNFYQVVQQDESIIASNGMAANMNQQMWFQGQQAGHNAQVAQGDAIMNNYWQTQKVNDGISQSYWNAQQTNDRLSQERSDAMLDNQRLYDDALGKEIHAPAGHNYYWHDQASGEVVGTNTNDPPDYLKNYTLLRKG